MAARGKWQGHPILYMGEQWVYEDNGEPVGDAIKGSCGVSEGPSEPRVCGHCGLGSTKEGHDGCLGTLPGVKNACCGHGWIKDAYVQFAIGSDIRGQDAVDYFTNVLDPR